MKKTIDDLKNVALCEEFMRGRIDRRLFLGRLAYTAASAGACLALLPLLRAFPANAAQVAEDDPRLVTQRVQYEAQTGTMQGYFAQPKDGTALGSVLVIHTINSLNGHIEDVTRRVAQAGYQALAPNFLSPSGGTPDTVEETNLRVRTLNLGETVEDAKKSIAWLLAQPQANGKVGTIGFCWGGTVSNWTAARLPTLNAGVCYYGNAPQIEEVPNIQAKMLIHYADLNLDPKPAASKIAYEDALKKNGKTYEMYVYEGTRHAFNDDTTPERYAEAASKLAWQRTMAHLDRYLR